MIKLVVNNAESIPVKQFKEVKVFDACINCGSLVFYCFDNHLFCDECDTINGKIQWETNPK